MRGKKIREEMEREDSDSTDNQPPVQFQDLVKELMSLKKNGCKTKVLTRTIPENQELQRFFRASQ